VTIEATPPHAVENLLKELMGARKAFRLYPASNPLAAEWLQRLYRAADALLGQGPPLRLRVSQTGFEWDGGQLAPRDPTLEAFRFELASRKITEVTLTPGVEPGELRELIELLNDTGGEPEAPARGLPTATRILLGGSLARYGKAEGVAASAAGNLLERAVEEILDGLGDVLRQMSEDRLRVAAWFGVLARDVEDAPVLTRAIRMLAAFVESEPDREIRYRALLETILALPSPLRSAVVRTGLLPAVRADVNVTRLLARLSGDELAELAGSLPAEELRALDADIEEAPVEPWMKARMRESIEDLLAEKDVAAAPLEPIIGDDDPSLIAFRERVHVGCAPDRVLEHSVAVLFILVEETESESYPVLLIGALEETIPEALRLEQLGLAVRVLQWLARPEKLRPEWQAEHQRRMLLLRRRLSGRATVAQLAEVARRGAAREVAECLRALEREALGEFVDVLAEEPDDGLRGRLLSVLAAVGADAAPPVRSRLTDPRWAVVRGMLGLLAEIGDVASLDAVVKAGTHPHPQVRREAARVVGILGGSRAVRSILGFLADPDLEVRRTALKALQGLTGGGAVAPIREFLLGPVRAVADLIVRREVITTLATSGNREAIQVLESLARRWLWPWQRHERRVRALARAALREAPPAAR
jgi:HEAT repeat protein